jgi:vancomycin resistance protein YoaR
MWDGDRRGAIALTLALIVLVLVLAALADRIVHDGKVLPGVSAGGVDLSGKTEHQAQGALEAKVARLMRRPITVRAGGRQLGVQPSVIGLKVDVPATVRAARRAGRSGNVINQVFGTVTRRTSGEQVPLVVSVDNDAFQGALDGWVTITGHGLVDGGLRFRGATVTEVMPKNGTGISRAEASKQLMSAIRDGSNNAGTLHIGATRPPIDAGDVSRAASRARAILAHPVVLTVNARPIILAPALLGASLRTQIVGSRLVVTTDPAALRIAFGPALAAVETPPQDASFDVNGSSVSVIPAVTGHQVDMAAVGAQITAGRHAIIAALQSTQPIRTTAWAQGLHINQLVGSFTTYHHCCEPRVTNIHRAADVINGTIIPPGGIFSLNNALGPRTAAKGYVPAPAIGADLEDEDTLGGGVSQLSTTLYNAVFFGCYQDTTHTVHAVYISRYPMGREATLNYPSIDNRFRNDSHAGILIRTYYSGTSITVSLFGNGEGRTCHAEGPNILKTIPSPVVYVTNVSLPPGSQQTVSSGQEGYIVENFRIIDTPGLPEKRERYVEHYAATPTKIERGP